MLTLQTDTFGLVPVRYSNLLPSIITKSPTHSAVSHRVTQITQRI